MKYEIYDKSKSREAFARLRLAPPNYDGSVDLVVVDEDGDPLETILTINTNGTITRNAGVCTQGFKVDDCGRVVIEEY